jgi:hypothetical protein
MDSLEKSIILIEAIEALHQMREEVSAYEKKYGEDERIKKTKDRMLKIQKLVDAFGRG